MPATKITGYAAITQIDPAVDVGVIIDVSDPTMDPSGTDKKFTSDFLKFAGMANISGLELVYNSATVLRVKVGKCGVNGKVASLAQTDYTSGSTMKDIANAIVTLGASTAYWVFISDAGVIGIEINDGTGDGGTPTFDTTYDYWKAASTGTAWRRIGKFWTNGSSQIVPFTMVNYGRRRIYQINDCESIPLVNGVAQASYTAITITPYCTGDDAEIIVGIAAFAVASNTAGGIRISIDGGTGQIAVFFGTGYVAATQGGLSDIKYSIPYTGTLHYVTIASGAGYVFLMGFSQFV